MKRSLVHFVGLLLGGSAFAQGTVYFANKITGAVEAPVYLRDWEGHTGVAAGAGASPATMMVAQLWQLSGNPGPVSDPIPFRDAGPGAGYWVGATRTLSRVPENSTAIVKVVAWTTAFGPAYDAVQAMDQGGWGESAPLTITTGGGLNPPAPLSGLTSFTVFFININIPEPSIRGMALLGAGLLMVRHKK